MAVRGSETVQSVLEAVAVEHHLCLLEEVGVARLHVLEVVGGTGPLAVTGLGEEAGGQSGFEKVEGLERSDQIPAQEAEALVCQVEVVEAQQL